jgi:hypothetical protein
MGRDDEAQEEWTAAAGELTGKIKRTIEKETSAPFRAIESRLKSLKFIAGLVMAIASAGFAVALYMSTFARTSDLAKLNKKLDEQAMKLDTQADRLDTHIAAEQARMNGLEREFVKIERQHEWEQRQLYELAKTARARRVPLPEKEEP